MIGCLGTSVSLTSRVDATTLLFFLLLLMVRACISSAFSPSFTIWLKESGLFAHNVPWGFIGLDVAEDYLPRGSWAFTGLAATRDCPACLKEPAPLF